VKKRATTKQVPKIATAKVKTSAKKARTSAASKEASARPAAIKREENLERSPAPSRNGRASRGRSSGVAAGKTSSEQPTRGPGNRKSQAVSGDGRESGGNGPAARASRSAPPPATSQDPIQFPEEEAPRVKTYLSLKQLNEFKTLLLAKRVELAGDVRNLTSEALNRTEPGSGEQSTMPIHMADLGTDTWEQDFTLGLIASEKALVREIDEALERIADKTYGICVATQEPITLERLRAKPWAKYCIEYARLREEGRAP